MELELKILAAHESNDFIQLINIFADVFEMENLDLPNTNYLEKLLLKPDFLVLVGKLDNEVVGGLTVYILHRYYSEKPVAYIYDLGVTPKHQRKGIGKQLISYLTHYCRENGFEDAYVEAETEDIQAVNFYKTTKSSSELQATHFTYSFDQKDKKRT